MKTKLAIFPLAIFLCISYSLLAQYRVSTVAGNGTAGFFGDNGAATNAQINLPLGVCADKAGNVYIADQLNARVRKVDALSGVITTIAGDGITPGNTGDGGPATAAGLGQVQGICLDYEGNIYVSSRHQIRKIDATTGIITTVAGSATYGYAGDGGNATDAKLAAPVGVAVDRFGNLYISDRLNNVIRKVTKATGIISTLAGTGTGGFSGENVPATDAKIFQPAGIAVDREGNVYIGDNARIRRIDGTTGIIETVAGNGIGGYTGDNGNAMYASLRTPTGISLDSSGSIYIVDGLSAVRRIDAHTHKITTIAGALDDGYAGDGLIGANARFQYPYGVFASADGNDVYVADRGNNRIRRLHISTVTVDDVNSQDDISVYPNPSAGLFKVELSSGVQDHQFEVYSAIGQVVYRHASKGNTVDIDLTALPAGMYFLHIRSAQNTTISKLVINR